MIPDSFIADVTRYRKVWNKFFKPLNAFNCRVATDRVQYVLWRAHDLHLFSRLINVVILYGANNFTAQK